MTKLLALFLTITLLAFATLAQAQTSQRKPGAQGPDISDGQKKTKLSKLPRKSEVDYLESRLKQLLHKIDYKLSDRKSLPFRLERRRSELRFMDQLHGRLELHLVEPSSKLKGFIPFSLELDYQPQVEWLREKWIPKYKKYLKKKFGTETTLSPEQLEMQVWPWLVPREKAERQAKVKRLEEELARDLKSIRRIRDKLAVLKDKVIRKEDIEKIKTKPDEKHKARRQDRGGAPKPKAEEDRIVEADEGGMLVGKSLKLSDLDGCGTFLKINWDEIMGFVSTPCPGLTGGRVATQADYLTYCNSIKRTRRYCGPPGPGTEKRIEISGIQGMPFNAFCLKLHYNILASKGDEYNSRLAQGNLRSVFKYDKGSRKLECYYVSKEQAKSLYQQYKNIGKDPSPAKPVARAEPKKDCKPGGGMNCATDRIEPPDTASPTGNRRPRRNKDRSPAFASSTDPSTGETITSVGNPDGSRTVTKTDKDGNILSREKVR